jgi:hypothetical protein
MVVKILKIVQWAISRKPTKLHTLNFNKNIFTKQKQKKEKKHKNMKIKIYPLFLNISKIKVEQKQTKQTIDRF